MRILYLGDIHGNFSLIHQYVKMYDIKDIAQVESPIGTWWIYILLVLAIAAASFFIYKFIKKRQNEPKVEAIVFKSPIEKATTLLQQLEKKELWQKGEIKDYYSSGNAGYNCVGCFLYSKDGTRSKIRNASYEEVRKLRGNQPKLQFNYLTLKYYLPTTTT